MHSKGINESIKKIIAGIISITIFLLLWQFSVSTSKLGEILPGPITVFEAFISSFTNKIGQYTIIQHTLFSLTRVLIAYFVAGVIGISLGLTMGRIKIV